MRQQNVLLEKISSGVRIVAEGHGLLRQEIDKINEKLEEHDKNFKTLEVAITEVVSVPIFILVADLLLGVAE